MTPAERKPARGLTGNTLKLVAVVTMFLDHFAVVFGEKLYPALPFLNANGSRSCGWWGASPFPCLRL